MRSKTVDRLQKRMPKDVEIFVDLYSDLVVRINQLLREKGITQKQLAEKMDKSPSEISKWLSGDHNFTLRSLAKLSAELGEPLLEVPGWKAPTDFPEVWSSCKINTFVVHPQKNAEINGKRWQVPVKTNSTEDLTHAG